MLSWLRRRRETAERIDAGADVLIGELGVGAEARRREYESSDDAIAMMASIKAWHSSQIKRHRIEISSSPFAQRKQRS
jgi:hypothetical protein